MVSAFAMSTQRSSLRGAAKSYNDSKISLKPPAAVAATRGASRSGIPRATKAQVHAAGGKKLTAAKRIERAKIYRSSAEISIRFSFAAFTNAP